MDNNYRWQAGINIHAQDVTGRVLYRQKRHVPCRVPHVHPHEPTEVLENHARAAPTERLFEVVACQARSFRSRVW
jgi:hypothetical protein